MVVIGRFSVTGIWHRLVCVTMLKPYVKATYPKGIADERNDSANFPYTMEEISFKHKDYLKKKDKN